MKPITIFLLIISAIMYGCGDLYASTAAEKENAALLQTLDSIIATQASRVKEKETRISVMRESLRKASADAERLGLTRQLYDEYIVFDSDSALQYAIETRSLVSKVAPEDYNELTKWRLNEVFIYTVQGLHDKALELLEEIDSSRLSDEVKSMYFNSLAYIYSLRSVYLQSTPEMAKEDLAMANRYRDSIQVMVRPENSELLWVPIATAIDKGDGDFSAIDVTYLKKTVDESTEATRKNAMDAYWLSRYYESTGDETSMLKYKTKAAIYDALIVNREIAAIQEIATYLFDKGDLNRAYTYLIYTVEQANLFHNRYRMVNLSDVLPTVRDAYREELVKRDKRLSTYVIVLTVLSVVLLLSILFIIFEYNKLRKMRNMLKSANSELQDSIKERDESIKERDEAIASLETANRNLNETNKQKLNLLAYAFKLTTQYINNLESYRKKLLKKYKGRQIDDLGMILNDPELIKEQFQGFYENFDKTVLSIYPDFIEEYNKTAAEDSTFSAETIAKTKTLNTRLRIYALRRLGITKSAEIAEMLNISIRTVYNNRPANTPEE